MNPLISPNPAQQPAGLARRIDALERAMRSPARASWATAAMSTSCPTDNTWRDTSLTPVTPGPKITTRVPTSGRLLVAVELSHYVTNPTAISPDAWVQWSTEWKVVGTPNPGAAVDGLGEIKLTSKHMNGGDFEHRAPVHMSFEFSFASNVSEATFALWGKATKASGSGWVDSMQVWAHAARLIVTPL